MKNEMLDNLCVPVDYRSAKSKPYSQDDYKRNLEGLLILAHDSGVDEVYDLIFNYMLRLGLNPDDIIDEHKAALQKINCA
jgi:hypothetical protein